MQLENEWRELIYKLNVGTFGLKQMMQVMARRLCWEEIRKEDYISFVFLVQGEKKVNFIFSDEPQKKKVNINNCS